MKAFIFYDLNRTFAQKSVMLEDKGIAKSSAVIQKEALLEDLKKKRKKLKTQLKRNRTMLSNLKEQIQEIGRDAMNSMDRLVSISKLTDEIAEIVKGINVSKKISKKDKKLVEDIAYEINGMKEEMGFTDEMKGPMDDASNFNPEDFIKEDEYGRKIEMDMFADFKVDMGEEEKKNFRKLFLQLANQVHPDRASSDIQRSLFHQYMLRLNNAKQTGDYEVLLKIQQELTELNNQTTPEDFEVPMTDLLDEKISLIKNEIDGIESQLVRIKKELKELRASEFGMMYKMDRESKNWGQSASDMHQEGNQILEMLSELKEALEEWLKTGKKPQYIYDMENGTGRFSRPEDQYEDEFFEPFDILDLLDTLVEMEEEEAKKKKKRGRRKK